MTTRLSMVCRYGTAIPVLAGTDAYAPLAGSLGAHLLDDLVRMGALTQAASAAERAAAFGDDEIDEWLPPILEPAHVVCIGLNYHDHLSETQRASTGYPTVFLRSPSSHVGHLAPIVRPRVSEQLDYEGELAVIIGSPGRYIQPDRAWSHVAGLSCYNDASVRDWQRHGDQWTPGKNFPGTGAFGPSIVPVDGREPDGFASWGLRTTVNGEELQSAVLGQMIFSVPELIAYVSSFLELRPGDVLATGTPGGIGARRDPPRFLQRGDLVEVEIDNVGRLSNPVVDEDSELTA